MNIEELIEEFYYLKNAQKRRRLEFHGPDRVFNEMPTEVAVRLKMEELVEKIGLASKK